MPKKNNIRSRLNQILGKTILVITVGLIAGVTLWALITLVRDSLVDFIANYTAINPLLVIVSTGIIILSVLGYNGRDILKKMFKS